MKEPPQNVSAAVRKLNPHLYGDSVSAMVARALLPMVEKEPLKRIRQSKTAEERLNKTEREFLGRLRAGVYGKMDHIGIQSITLQLGFDCRYTPDFWTLQVSDFRFWEVKGFMRDDARVKLYAAARAFPFWTFVLVEKGQGEWESVIIKQ